MTPKNADNFDLRQELLNTNALLEGHFVLSSGLHSDRYVQCARLLQYPKLAEKVGEELAKKIAEYSPDKIVSPAIGGIVIGQEVARALSIISGKDIPHIFIEKKDGIPTMRRGFEITSGEKVIVIEDVVTTGKSILEVVDVIGELGGEVLALASMVNRSGKEQPFELAYEFLMSVSLNVYDPKDCPLCKSGVEAIKPGSREDKK